MTDETDAKTKLFHVLNDAKQVIELSSEMASMVRDVAVKHGVGQGKMVLAVSMLHYSLISFLYPKHEIDRRYLESCQLGKELFEYKRPEGGEDGSDHR